MPTTAEFDTFLHDQWSGEMTVTVTDPDGTANRVLDPQLPFNVQLRWSLYSEDPGNAPVTLITSGHWKVDAYAESLGTGAGGFEGSLGTLNKPWASGTGNASEKRWDASLTVQPGTINLPGIYKITVMVQYHTALNEFTPMVGFAEYPPICFSRLP